MNTIDNAGTANISQAAPLTNTSSTAGAGAEFDTFIRLLTSQIRNQDPLQPLDSTQFVEQLATFSTLEQQVRSNDSLESIASMIGDLHAIIASEWIGQTVTVESSWVPYTGETLNYGLTVPTGVDRAQMTVRNADGAVLYSERLDLSQDSYSWNGQTDTGETVPVDSLNQITIDLYQDGRHLGAIAPQIITTVTTVGSEGGSLRLGTNSHLSADIGEVRKVAQ